jgi:tyrosyl-tRNA synthetase
VGRELQKDYGQERQVVLTFPLLVGLDGKEKMSKSLDNYIGIDESPEIMYEKAMKIPDDCLLEYFKLTTDVELEDAKQWITDDIVLAHRKYAEEIIKMYHGENRIKEAEERYKQVAKGKIPDNIKEINISNETREINICDLLVKTGFAPSKSEAKRMIQGKGVKINSNIVDNLGENIVLEEPIVLQFGKNKFIKVV